MDRFSRRRAVILGSGATLGTAGALAGGAIAGAAGGTGGAGAERTPGGRGESGREASRRPASLQSGTWHRLVVVTANIGRDRLGERERAIRDVRHAVTVDGKLAAPLVGWQEIGEGDGDVKERAFVDKHFGSAYRNLFLRDAKASRVPMSVPRSFAVLDRRVTFCHGGKEHVSPHRVITQAVLERTAEPGLRFVLANTHYVAGAFNGRTDPAEAWRKEKWQVHFRKHRDEVLAHWNAQGYPVIWTGDVNRTPMPLLMPRKEKRAFAKGIDQIGWVPGSNGTEIRLNRTTSVPMHVDGHDARVAVMQIRTT